MAWLGQDWVLWFAAGLLLVGGVWLTGWSLFHDRARGRRRCPKCWYDLRGTPGLRCSECGYEAKRERQLFSTRRRWRLAALGVLLMLAASSAGLAPKVRRDGWLSLVPTTVLILAVPPAAEDWIWPPVGMLSPGDTEDDLLNRPSSFENRAADELARRIASGAELWNCQWRYLIREKRAIRTRRKWPQTVPFMAALRLPLVSRGSITVCPRLQDATDATFLWDDGVFWRDGPHLPEVVGVLAAGTTEVIFDCAVWKRKSFWREAGESPLWTGTVEIPLECAPSIDDVIRPDRDPALTEAMRAALRVKLSFHQLVDTGPPRSAWCLSLGLLQVADSPLNAVALGLGVDVLHDGKVAGTRRFRRQDFWPRGDPRQVNATIDLPGVDEEALFGPDAADHWSLRVRGDGEMALTDWDRDQYWAGEFTLPLSEVLAP